MLRISDNLTAKEAFGRGSHQAACRDYLYVGDATNVEHYYSYSYYYLCIYIYYYDITFMSETRLMSSTIWSLRRPNISAAL